MDVATRPATAAPVFLSRETRFVVGCDAWSPTNDPTAISVLEHMKGV